MKLSSPIYRLKRQARRLSRDRQIPLHAALDAVAQQEGYSSWSLLAARYAKRPPVAALLSQLKPSDLVLLAARPGHGKTMIGLELLAKAIDQGRDGAFFTLEYNEREARERFQAVCGPDTDRADDLRIDASDNVNAAYIQNQLRDAPSGALAVVDYLQVMDQQRTSPPLSEQIAALRTFADRTGVVLVFLSQIDRTFDLSDKPLPGLDDLRLPNPLDLTLFDKACFLNDGKIAVEHIRARNHS